MEGAGEANAARNTLLYVGNLDSRVTDALLRDIFETISPVSSVKILQDRNHSGLNYGFVEFFDHSSAEMALNSLDQREIFGSAIKVNWAVQTTKRAEDPGSYHIFVGDLSNEVNDEVLRKAFQPFGSLTEARIMWDPNTGKTRGYGFVSYKEKPDAEMAINQMNGEWLGSRSIRVNWAQQRDNDRSGSVAGMSLEALLAQTPAYNTTVYVGNVSPETNQHTLMQYFQNFGPIAEIRMQQDKGYCFFKFETHESAGAAIHRMNGEVINGKAIKCSWGKEKNNASSSSSSSGMGMGAGAMGAAHGMMYGVPPMGYPAMYGAPPYYQMPPPPHGHHGHPHGHHGHPQQQPYGYEYYGQPQQYDYQQYNYQQ